MLPALRTALDAGGWKLIWSGYGETYELYEPDTDPRELENRASDEPERLSRLVSDLDSEIRRWSLQETDAESEDTLEQLRQLGYVE